MIKGIKKTTALTELTVYGRRKALIALVK